MRFKHRRLGVRRAPKPDASRAEATRAGWAAGARAGLLKGQAPPGPTRRPDLLMVRGVAQEVGIEAEEKQGCVTPPPALPRDDKGGEGCVNAPRGNNGISIP